MHEVARQLWVGSQADFEALDVHGTEWGVVHAARDPWHRQLLGYTGRGAPPDHPEYLFARRGNRLYLNLVDAQDPKYISRKAVDEAMRFIEEQLTECRVAADARGVLVHCNQGGSRGPTLGMLYLATFLPEDFVAAEAEFRKVCTYLPNPGMREFARENWARYRARAWRSDDAVRDATALDMAEQIWQRLCESLKTDPARAREELIESLVQALSAQQQDRLTHGSDQGSRS